MEVSIKKIAFLAMAGVLSLSSCKKDDNNNNSSSIAVSTITAGGTDLYGATSATDVAADADIMITFTAAVDQSSTSGIKLMQGSNEVATTSSVAGKSVTITPTNNMHTGTSYTLMISGVKSTAGKTASTVSVDFTTEGVGLGTVPQKNSQILYLPLDGTTEDLTGNASEAFAQNTWATDRFGKTNSAAYFSGETTMGTGDIIEMTGENFIAPSMTISAWFKINTADMTTSAHMFGLCVEKGYFFEVDKALGWCKFATSHKMDPDPDNHYFATAWTDPNGSGTRGEFEYTGNISDIIKDNQWNQVVMTYDATTSTKKIFVNGTLLINIILAKDATSYFFSDMAIMDKADGTGDPITGLDKNLTLGYWASPANTATSWADYNTNTDSYVGALDDFRIWNKTLTDSEVSTLYNAEKAQ